MKQFYSSRYRTGYHTPLSNPMMYCGSFILGGIYLIYHVMQSENTRRISFLNNDVTSDIRDDYVNIHSLKFIEVMSKLKITLYFVV